MEIIKIILLGLIQGITEWLPISSTGHLLLFDALLPLKASDSFKSVFMVLVQLGSVLSVVVLYFQTLWPFQKTKKECQKRLKLWSKVLVATLPAGVVGVLLDEVIDHYLGTYAVIALALLFYGVLYLFVEKRVKISVRRTNIESITYQDALALGCFQMLALIPGTSRSGSTILGGLLCGFSRETASEFSFFMALPVMVGASLLRLLKYGFAFSSIEWLLLLLGAGTAFFTSLVVIKGLLSYVKNHTFVIFGLYRILLAFLVLLFFTFH